MRCGLESHLLHQFSVDAVTKQNSRMGFRKSWTKPLKPWCWIADVEWTPKSKALNHLFNFKLLMQEAPNSKEKDEQQERGNYDSANYME